jgi:hypothetical protein
MQHSSRKTLRILKGVARLLLLFGAIMVLGLETYTLVVVHTEGNTPLPPTIGNFARVRALLRENGQQGEFAFAVLGDTKANQTSEHIIRALQAENLSFMVLLGDCLRKGTRDTHRFLKAEWVQELVTDFPVFYVVGNHDVDSEEFPVSQFEETYGPTNFSFDYQGYLFIFLRVLDKAHGYSTEETLAFLNRLLSTQRHEYDKVFVFMHIPPPVSSDFYARGVENPDEFVLLFDRFNVDYVFAGDYHGYARVRFRNTNYVISGGGGAHLERQKFGKFHHALVIRVGEGFISERILHVREKASLEDRIEYLAFSEVFPWLRDHWRLGIILNLGFLGIFFLGLPGVTDLRWVRMFARESCFKG